MTILHWKKFNFWHVSSNGIILITLELYIIVHKNSWKMIWFVSRKNCLKIIYKIDVIGKNVADWRSWSIAILVGWLMNEIQQYECINSMNSIVAVYLS